MNRRDFLLGRIKQAWRTFLGRPAEPKIVTVEEVPPEHLALMSKALENLAAKMQQAATTELDTPCADSRTGYHCICWHRGEDRCCYCDAGAPEDREEIRHRGI